MIMPMPYYPTSAGVGAQITMGTLNSLPYFVSAQAAADFGVAETGSATGNRSADGGTFEILGQGNAVVATIYILGGNASSTVNVNIDGTDYTANYQGPNNGYDFYTFNGSIFSVGNTYTVIVT